MRPFSSLPGDKLNARLLPTSPASAPVHSSHESMTPGHLTGVLEPIALNPHTRLAQSAVLGILHLLEYL